MKRSTNPDYKTCGHHDDKRSRYRTAVHEVGVPGGEVGLEEAPTQDDPHCGEPLRRCQGCKPDRLRYAVSERVFDIRTEVVVGEWLQVGPAGNRVYLGVPEGGTGAGVLVLHA